MTTTTTTIPGGRISELVRYFLRLGFLGFGGPVALVGQMERELVDERKWLTKEQMREAIAICQSLPGPLAIQVGIYVSYLRGGFWGAWAGGWAFILPNFVIVAALGALYVYVGDLQPVTAIFYGVSPAVIALILHSCYRLAKLGMEDWLQWAIAAVCLAVTVILQAEVALLFIGAGIVGIMYYGSLFKRTPPALSVTVAPVLAQLAPTASSSTKPAHAIEVQDSAPRLDYIRATPAAHLQSGKTPRRTSKAISPWTRGSLVSLSVKSSCSRRDKSMGNLYPENLYFEDAEVGTSLLAGPYLVTKSEIIQFAKQYDPIPRHIDEQAAARSIFGGLTACAAHTFSIFVFLTTRLQPRLHVLAGMGWDELRLPNPVRPDDVLDLEVSVLEKRESKSKSDRGIVRNQILLRNQRRETVLQCISNTLVARRPDANAPSG